MIEKVSIGPTDQSEDVREIRDVLDRILDKEMGKVVGFPLRRLTSTRQETKKQVTETRSEMNIVEMKTVDVPDTVFEVPKGFAEVDPNESGLERGLKKLEREQQEQRKKQQQ